MTDKIRNSSLEASPLEMNFLSYLSLVMPFTQVTHADISYPPARPFRKVTFLKYEVSHIGSCRIIPGDDSLCIVSL